LAYKDIFLQVLFVCSVGQSLPPRQKGEPQAAQVTIKMKSKSARGPPMKMRRHFLEQSQKLLFFCTISIW